MLVNIISYQRYHSEQEVTAGWALTKQSMTVRYITKGPEIILYVV